MRQRRRSDDEMRPRHPGAIVTDDGGRDARERFTRWGVMTAMNDPYLGGAAGPQGEVFEVVVAGEVLPSTLVELEDVEVFPHEWTTVLSGRFEDQAGLYQLLARLRSFALEVVEVRRVADGQPDPGPDED
jgi:hypothetical protein